MDLDALDGSQLEDVLASMQVPFQELTELGLFSDGVTPPVIPDLFLGGSAPRMQILQLNSAPFLGLPKLLPRLLSATQLTSLHLTDIPHSGDMSPKR